MSKELFNEKLLNVVKRVESALSVLFFTGMFGAIIIQVFFRYVLKNPLVWPYEFSVYCFIYIVFFGAAVASRRNTHIAFGMIYDRMSVRKQLVISAVSNVFIAAVILMTFPSTFSFIRFMGTVTSSAMGIPMYLILSCFPLGLGLIALYVLLWAMKDIRECMRLRSD